MIIVPEIFEELFVKSEKRIKNTELNFKRYLYNSIDDSERLIGITGARGTGKTTLLLQKLKEKNLSKHEGLYISLDDLFFHSYRLIDVVETFAANGGRLLVLDEVHKYETWSIELKNTYDLYPELKVMFTGSSVLEMSKTQGDLSRRAMVYKLETMSLREHLTYEHDIYISPISFDELIHNHEEIANNWGKEGIKPYTFFDVFLKRGSYPFSAENKSGFYEKLRNTIQLIIESDMFTAGGIDFATAMKIRKLLIVISGLVPYKPNLIELAAKLSTDRRNLYKYLDLLERSRLINLLVSDEKGFNIMVKPEMIYLENPSLAYALCEIKPEKGMLRETFFFNQLKPIHHISYTPAGDFLVDNKYIFEVGGKNKTFKQIKNLPASYLAIDEIESGHGNKIPLWMFGLLR
ncbi:MAG: AAA family ATPase [Bacteroidota bacterium]|nr:AAA family ATPase [Bacteroidota bacterium]